jgi:hypothetical protein
MKIVFWRSKSFPMGRCDQGIKFCSKIQSAQNCFKSNGSIGLVVTNPTQLIWVQMDVGSKRYHVLFKMTNMQKRGVDCTVCTVRTDTHVASHTTHGRQLFAQLVGDMACLQRMEWRHMAQSMATTCPLFIGLKFIWSPPDSSFDPVTSTCMQSFGKYHQPMCHHSVS